VAVNGSPPPTVLIVDDEAQIIDLAELYLHNEGFNVRRATSGSEAIQSLRDDPPDLVILDIMLPGMDGWEITRQIRNDSALPIIMLTARGDPIDRVVGLELGADDYVVKPFHGRELVARVKAVLRRTSPADTSAAATSPDAVVTVGDVTIDPARRLVTVAGEPASLRAREFDLLLYLAQHEGLVLSRDQLLDRVWGYDFLGDSRTIDVHVAHVRKDLAPSRSVTIETVWGIGYKLIAQAPSGNDAS
jgi:two-component system alkaline phosphatase synthesis response regulator PhoP/two-component system response regulator ResD